MILGPSTFNKELTMGQDPSAKSVVLIVVTLWLLTIIACSFVAATASSFWTYRLMSGDIRALQERMNNL